MQLVMLAGELGEKYGTQHEYYNLRTPADGIRLLCINYPGLQKDLMTAHQNGVGYKLIQSGAAMGYDELHLPFGSRPMMLVPVISGSGGSTGQILAGVGLVAAAIVLGPAAGGFLGLGSGLAGAGAGIIGGSAATAVGAIGASLVLGGVANMISPQPELPRLGSRRMDGTNSRGPGPQGVTRGASGQQSYAYTGPANTVGNGVTIPVVYGQAMVGGHMLSVAVDVTDDSDPLAVAIKQPGEETILINGAEVDSEFKEEAGFEGRRLSRRDARQYRTSINNRRRVISSSTGFGYNLSKNLEPGDEETFGQIDTKSKYQDQLDVFFHISGGLYGRAGDENSTKIDGFITYRIEILHTLSGDDVVVATAEATIQGYLKRSDDYFWCHRLRWRLIEGNEQLRMSITIVDADSDSSTTQFRVPVFGYDLG